MRKTLIIALVLFIAAASAGAQTKYKDIRHLYDVKDYFESEDDVYSPSVAGFISFLLPGFGQIFEDEWERGLGIIAVNLGCGVTEWLGCAMTIYTLEEGQSYYRDYGYQSSALNRKAVYCLGGTLLIASAHLVFNVWNVYDAIRIAKVKNLYYRDISLEPHFAFTPTPATGFQPAPGLSLKLSF